MVKLSKSTLSRLLLLFSAEDAGHAIQLLESNCADNLPFFDNATPDDLERVRFAALKVSRGELEELKSAIKLAQIDWRDLLVSAGFATDVGAHNEWTP